MPSARGKKQPPLAFKVYFYVICLRHTKKQPPKANRVNRAGISENHKVNSHFGMFCFKVYFTGSDLFQVLKSTANCV